MSRPATLTVERPRAAAWRHTAPAPRGARSLRLAGVVVRADLSCAFGAMLAAWTFASGFLPETNPGHTTLAYWMAGSAGALLFVLSVAMHEIGHAIAARRAGLAVARITLSFVGGTSELVGAIRYARHELIVAAAGPLASLVVALVAVIAHVVIVEMAGPGLAATVAALVAVSNLGIVLFNAIPGLPLDGGRVLRATVWGITGRQETATRLAVALGRRLGHALVALAVISAAFGFVALALWTALLGLVLREN